jgi:hypothetical protein
MKSGKRFGLKLLNSTALSLILIDKISYITYLRTQNKIALYLRKRSNRGASCFSWK